MYLTYSLSIGQLRYTWVASISWLFVNGASLNTGVHVSFELVLSFLSGYIPRSAIARSYDNLFSVF